MAMELAYKQMASNMKDTGQMINEMDKGRQQ